MSHSVEDHLDVAPEVYDVEIRRFVPGYDAMLDEVAALVARWFGTTTVIDVLDLGAGTGALSAHLAAQLPDARLTLLDVDAAMLERARNRMNPWVNRVQLRNGSFLDPLPRCDVAVASLSLHHVHDADDKRAVYRNVRAAISPGGLLVTADAMISGREPLRSATFARWADHLVHHGDTRAQAYARFEGWAKEDRYLPVEEELASMRQAGFAATDVVWRVGPTCVVAAMVE